MRWVAALSATWMWLGASCSLIDLPPADTGSGGGASTAECQDATDCAETGTTCIERSCDAGSCAYLAATDLTPLPNQAVGDCRNVVCDGEGGEKSLNIDDAFDDGNPCTQDLCDDGMPRATALVGTSCDSGFCDAEGDCVECLEQGDCDGELCVFGQCVPATCVDNALSTGETDIDCGGQDCPPCGVGDDCLIHSDCQSLVCSITDPGTCQAPTCSDGVHNGNESDIDCGGGCTGCETGEMCGSPGDCASFVCAGLICSEPSCGDGVVNGTESDVDCGGSCSGCATGKACNVASDCVSGVCSSDGICAAPTCNDGVRNGNETGIDCGGGCTPCVVMVPM